MKPILDQFFQNERRIHQAFGYQPGWRYFPTVDHRDVYWFLGDPKTGPLKFWKSKQEADAKNEAEQYSADVPTNFHLFRYVWRCAGHTMILMDTHQDGNIYLGIFDDKKEVRIPGKHNE